MTESVDRTPNTDLAAGQWRLIREEVREGPMQMALDEVAAETAADGGPWTIRVYSWPDVLSLGYHQDPDSVDWAACDRHAVGVTRRQTGGGGIYHDTVGDISYSIAVPGTAVSSDLLTSYEQLCEPVIQALERLGVAAEFASKERPAVHEPACYLRAVNPAHDIVVDGKKVSGNAQYRQRDAVVQHGSLSYRTHPEQHLATFVADIDESAFRDRVTSIEAETSVEGSHGQDREHGELKQDSGDSAGSGLARETVVETLEATLAEWAGAEVEAWTDEELSRARSLAAEKYGNKDWVRNRKQ